MRHSAGSTTSSCGSVLTGRLPKQVRRIDGGSPRSTDDAARTSEILVPDEVGEVFTEFHQLQQGYGSGLQWTEA